MPSSSSPFIVKICGLKTAEAVETAIDAGADLIGLVFHPKSPRYVELEQSKALADQARGRIGIVALIVDFTPDQAHALTQALRPDWLQLHGRETPDEVAAIRSVTGIKIIKAVGVSEAADLVALKHYAPVCDALLIDAKPPKGATYPGGHGQPFDWNILKGLDLTLPFSWPFWLSGGLNPDNVATAIHQIRAMGVRLNGVDVSSGVESASGVKDLHKIKLFIEAARQASQNKTS